MVLLRHSDVTHAWKSVKGFVGNAWHKGGKFLGAVDKYADLGLRIFSAASPMLPSRALEMGMGAANDYNRFRGKVDAFRGAAENTRDRFRMAAPELGI